MRKQWDRFVRNRDLISSAVRPGFGLKRWLLLLAFGVFLTGFAVALVLHQIAGLAESWLDFLTFGFLPVWLRALLFLSAGLAVVGVATWQVTRRIVLTLLPDDRQPRDIEIVSSVLQRRQRRRGPKVVAIGGGTGMPQLLRGLLPYTDNITAVVTVADDGGSSGRLRDQLQMLPPGDFRNNIAALSEAEDLMTRLFQYRFADRELTFGNGNGSSELAGHSFGNLFITTMAAVSGSFERGLMESSRVLAVRGRILPSTLAHVTLCAEIARLDDAGEEVWSMVEGESRIPEAGGRIQRVFLKPDNVNGYPAVTQAILEADLIVAGPGSFFTSVMPNLLVPSVRDAICASRAVSVYVCNMATQPGETDGFSVSDHMCQLRLHAGDAFTTVLANSTYDLSRPLSSSSAWVPLPDADERIDYELFAGDVADSERPWRHDSTKLAERLMAVYAELSARQAELGDETAR